MIVATTGAAGAIRFTPSWLEQDENPPVFLLRAGSVFDRELMESELASDHLAGRVWPWEIQDAIVAGFRHIGGSDAEHLIALAEADRADALESEDEKQTLAEALDILSRHWPAYRRLLAQMQRRNSLIPLVAFRRFCCGWDNVDAPFELGFDKCLTDSALAGVDPLALRAAGFRAYNLQYGAGTEKNSDAPSKSEDAPATSTADEPSRADGSSEASDTPKTRP